MTKHEIPSQSDGPAIAVDQTASSPNPWKGLRRTGRFFENEEIAALVQRGLFYVRAGVPIHFQGTAGRGKTAIAMEIARRLGRPVSVMTGNDWLDAEDLIGKEVGQSTRSVVDKYVQRVRRSEATVRYDWEKSILAEAMAQGHTLVYDEFTRSSAKANGILLSVLSEGVLISTDPLSERGEIEAHPDFRIILTSNPGDYAGVNAAPDALLDRMITFPLKSYSELTEAGIVAARTGVDGNLARRIVHLVRSLHEKAKISSGCSMRASIMIAQIAALRLRSAQLSDALMAQIASDVLTGRGLAFSTGQIAQHLESPDKVEEPS